VRDAVVVPRENHGNAEACAVLLLKCEVDRATIKNPAEESALSAVGAANATLAEYQQIRKWAVWPEPDFPRTPTGKARIALITEWAAHAGSEKDSGPLTPQIDRITRVLSEKGGSAALRSLSSLDRVELLSELEQRYNVEINEEAFSEAQTAADLRRLIEDHTQHEQAPGPAPGAWYRYSRWAQSEPVRWLRLLVYYLLVWPATQILGHPGVRGRRHLKGLSGPVIVVSNHITRRADIGLILAALPARFRHRLATAMGGETVQRMRTPPRDWFLAKRWAYQLGYFLVIPLFNIFPLPQLSGFRRSFQFAGESADRGYSVLIFPEGEVNNSEDGRMAAFRSGIGLLVENLALPIVPMRLDGVWQMKRERRRLAKPREITVHIGAPVRFPPGTPPEVIARRLQATVTSL